MKVWKGMIMPFLKKITGQVAKVSKKFFKYMLRLFKRTAKEVAKQIPEWILIPIKNKVIELADEDISGEKKMEKLRKYSKNLLGEKADDIGDFVLDTFLQNIAFDLRNSNFIN